VLKRAATSAFLALVLCAQSQPAPKDSGETHQDKAAVHDHSAAEDKRGTKDTPIFVQVTNPTNGDAIAAEIEKYAHAQTKEGRDTFIFSCLLVAVGALQGAALIYTALVTNKAANAAQTAAEALPAVERSYVFLSDKIEIEWESDPEAKSLEESIARVLGDGDTHNESVTGAIRFPLKNHGKTPAILSEIYLAAGYFLNSNLSMGAATGGAIPAGMIISAGEDSGDQFGCQLSIRLRDWREAKNGAGYVLFFGRVLYRDVFGKPHETGFCREYNFTRARFILAPNGKLNYYT
jgi:hypothetical protein